MFCRTAYPSSLSVCSEPPAPSGGVVHQYPNSTMKDLSSSKLKRIVRETKLVAKGLASTKHPILAHVIPMRRCNLSCGYCNEYDKVSEPVPLEVMKARLDRLASFGTSVITISGGEPMLHPQIYEIISHIRSRGMM